MKTALPPVGVPLEAVELPPPSGIQEVITPSSELKLAPAPRPAPPPILPSTVARGSVPVETERDDVVHPPRNASLYWAFTNNVFEFPFRWCALTQWIFSSIGLAATAECSVLAVMGFFSASMPGALQGGVFALVAFLFLLFSLSYLTSCFVDITVNTAHNIDKAYDWPNPDYRERLLFLVRVFWVATIAGTIAAAIAGVCSLASEVLYPIFFVVLWLLFPILLLAGLEADSLFWPVSKPIFRSVRNAWRAWLFFYLISASLGAGCGLLAWALFAYSPLLMPLIAGPMCAAAIFVYGRLLGRLAWFILHKADSQQQKNTAQRVVDHQRWNI